MTSMSFLGRPYVTAFCGAAVLALSGCATMDTAMADFRNSIASISLPTFGDGAEAGREEGKTGDHIAPQTDSVFRTATSRNCPQVSIVPTLESMHLFINPEQPRPQDRLSSAFMNDVTSRCSIENGEMVVHINMDIESRLGPRARIRDTDRPNFAYPYFVAISAPNGSVMAKEVHIASVSFSSGQDSAMRQESIIQNLPLDIGGAHRNELLIGFQLNEAELAYNRSLQGTRYSGSHYEPAPQSDTAPQNQARASVPLPPDMPSARIGAALASTIGDNSTAPDASEKKAKADPATPAEDLSEIAPAAGEDTSPETETIIDITAD